MMNLPNAAYTNAAHKNGVLSLGCIFLPWPTSPGGPSSREMRTAASPMQTS